MSVAAVMLVKDEEDIIGYTIDHLLGQVDQIIVSDNDSTDDTSEILSSKQEENKERIVLVKDDEVGYWQDRKTTALAQMARLAGHEWVLPCDADEYWYAPDIRWYVKWVGRRGKDEFEEVLQAFTPAAKAGVPTPAADRPAGERLQAAAWGRTARMQ